MRISFFFAYKFLVEKKRSTLSVIIGIAIGVAVLVSFLSLTNSYRQALINRILGTSSHIRVMTRQGAPIYNYKSIKEKIAEIEEVIYTAPLLTKAGLVQNGNKTANMRLIGIKPAQLKVKITYGTKQSLEESKAIVGAKLAKRLGAYPGTQLNVIFPKNRAQRLRVGAVFDAGLNQFNAEVIYISFRQAQKIFQMQGRASLMQVNLKDPLVVEKVSEKISQRTGYYTVSWKKANQNLLSALAIERRLFMIILIFMLVIAGFGIANTLNMMVAEKEENIGLLKSIGTSETVIKSIFLLQGLIMGLLGTLLGIILGIIITIILSNYPIEIPTDLYDVEYLKIQLEWSQFMMVSFLTIIISSLASLYPAHKAAQLEAVEVLRK